VPAHALHAALQQVAFERVRITLRREDGSIALDTVVDFPAGADSLVLGLNVPLPPSAPSTGVPLSLNLGYVNAAGDTVFRGGPLAVTVTPGAVAARRPRPFRSRCITLAPAPATAVVITPRASPNCRSVRELQRAGTGRDGAGHRRHTDCLFSSMRPW
jgi:hypothetical protein